MLKNILTTKVEDFSLNRLPGAQRRTCAPQVVMTGNMSLSICPARFFSSFHFAQKDKIDDISLNSLPGAQRRICAPRVVMTSSILLSICPARFFSSFHFAQKDKIDDIFLDSLPGALRLRSGQALRRTCAPRAVMAGSILLSVYTARFFSSFHFAQKDKAKLMLLLNQRIMYQVDQRLITLISCQAHPDLTGATG